MTPEQFKRLPPWVGAKDLAAVGFSRKILLALRHYIAAEGGGSSPRGKIGYLRISKTFGRYRRSDAATLLGSEWV